MHNSTTVSVLFPASTDQPDPCTCTCTFTTYLKGDNDQKLWCNESQAKVTFSTQCESVFHHSTCASLPLPFHQQPAEGHPSGRDRQWASLHYSRSTVSWWMGSPEYWGSASQCLWIKHGTVIQVHVYSNSGVDKSSNAKTVKQNMYYWFASTLASTYMNVESSQLLL